MLDHRDSLPDHGCHTELLADLTLEVVDAATSGEVAVAAIDIEEIESRADNAETLLFGE